MNIKEIEQLINSSEKSKLDFKREWYKSTDKNNHEIIKDFVALANGNPYSVGDDAYLIVGVEEIENGSNILHNISTKIDLIALKKQVLQNLKNYVDPPITEFEISFIEIRAKNILVIKIPQHGYLIKLKKGLHNNRYRIGDILYRAGESTETATYEVAKQIEKSIEKYTNQEREKPHNKEEFYLVIDKFRHLDVIKDDFSFTSKEVGIKLYEIWKSMSHKYSQYDFAQLIDVDKSDIHSYFKGEKDFSLNKILMISDTFNLKKDYFFTPSYWMRSAIWKDEIVRFSLLNIAYPKENISKIVNKGEFYYSILSDYARRLCNFYEVLYGEKQKNFFDENQIIIDQTLKESLSLQYYKLLEQYPENDKSRSLVCNEKILKSWCWSSGVHISRIIVEGIKKIDISNIEKPIVTCRFDLDIKKKKVTKQGYNPISLTMGKGGDFN